MFRWIKNIYNLSANLDYYEKEIALVREQAQVDLLTKDQELGRLYKKINELSNGTKKT